VYLLSRSYNKNYPEGNQQLPSDHVLTLSSGKKISVRIADTPQRQEWGLSYFSHLAEDSGMIFLFSHLERQGFWMKDMNFPLDIVWMKRDIHDPTHYKVVSLDEQVSPESYPKIFYPSEPIDTVLEIGAGNARAWGIVPGQEGYLTKH
jgi:hypothetical protein